MATLKIEIPIHIKDDQHYAKIVDFFRDFSFNARLLDEEYNFQVRVMYEKEENQDDWNLSSGRIELLTNISGIADCTNNTLITGKKWYHSFHDLDGNYHIVEHDDNYALDELASDEIKDIVIGFVMAIILADPSINMYCIAISIYFDDMLIRKEILLKFSIHNQCVDMYPDLFRNPVALEQAWNWIKKNTSLYGKRDRSPMAFSALTYILARDYHEAILYSMIGLESIYSSKHEKGITEKLKKRIPLVLPGIDSQQIKNLYKIRSDVVHGNIQLGICLSMPEAIENDDEYENNGILAAALLFASVRKLIEKDSTAISFKEITEYSYE